MKEKELAALEQQIKEQQATIEIIKECLIALGINPSVFGSLQKRS